jgi:hypothetical protein
VHTVDVDGNCGWVMGVGGLAPKYDVSTRAYRSCSLDAKGGADHRSEERETHGLIGA